PDRLRAPGQLRHQQEPRIHREVRRPSRGCFPHASLIRLPMADTPNGKRVRPGTRTEIGETRRVSDDYGVVAAVTKGARSTRKRKAPCAECPFRTDVPPGKFPAEAFRESAHTSYDAAMAMFACHMGKA